MRVINFKFINYILTKVSLVASNFKILKSFAWVTRPCCKILDMNQ